LGFSASKYTSPAGICGPSVTIMKFWISSSMEVSTLSFGGAMIRLERGNHRVIGAVQERI